MLVLLAWGSPLWVASSRAEMPHVVGKGHWETFSLDLPWKYLEEIFNLQFPCSWKNSYALLHLLKSVLKREA